MTKITFIGAGSLAFTRQIVRDILTFPLLRDATISLVDVDPERLAYAKRCAERIVVEGHYPAKIEATLDRAEGLRGANAVISTILVGGVKAFQPDLEIPKKYGVDICVGDTRGVAGIFRALRTIPVALDICRDMERLCPSAILLNYTNPMTMICRAIQRETKIQATGLCYSVRETVEMLARWIGAPKAEIKSVCAGTNHMAWYLQFEWKGQDAYPLLREALQKPEIYEREKVRNEMFLHLGYYSTESSGHNSEYNWWFRKRPDLLEKYCTGPGFNPGEYAHFWKPMFAGTNPNWWKDYVETWLSNPEPLDLNRSEEYASYIINAYTGGEVFKFNGNVANEGYIINLPYDANVEIPVYVDASGYHPLHVGALPPQLAALANLTIAYEEMAVEACLTGDPTMVFHAVAYDPLSAAVLSLAEIKQMVNELLAINRDYLPTFKHFAV